MKACVFFLLAMILVFSCTKEKAAQKPTPPEEIEVVVYATHTGDTTRIDSTAPVHVLLK